MSLRSQARSRVAPSAGDRHSSGRSNRRPSAALPPLPPTSPDINEMPHYSSHQAFSQALHHPQSMRSSHHANAHASSSRHHLEPPRRPVLESRHSSNSVTDRMRAAGWQGVGSDSASSSRVDLHSPDSPPLDKRGSADSGYSEGSHDEKSGYFGNWNKIKKAMWGGEEEEGAPERVPTPQSYVWDKIMAATSVVSVGVSESVARARLGEDDDTIGPDGDTKLTRVIKEYHISQATCSEDLPHWLFTASELSVRTSAASRAAEREEREHSYSSHHDRPVHRQVSNVSTDSYSRARRGSIEDFNPYTHQAPARRGSASSEHGLPPGVASRAADRLRAMREAKRSAH